MPYANVPEELWGKMDDCVQKVQDKGHDKESAIAICYASIVEGKALPEVMKSFEFDPEAFKIGMRNSKEDRERIRKIRQSARQIHDISIELEPTDADEQPTLQDDMEQIEAKAIPSDDPDDYLIVEDREKKTTWHLQVKENGKPNHRLMGAAWAALHEGFRGNKYEGPGKREAIEKLIRLYASEGMELPGKMIDTESVVCFGDAVKYLGDGRVGGYLIRFSGPDDPDLTGEYFTADTDFGDAEKSAVYYHHGLDPVIGKRKLSQGLLRKDDVGIWIETQLQIRDEYEKFIMDMAEAGKMGWSSGTASHLVEKEPKGKAVWIKSWQLGLDASITPTPAEPRNSVIPLKSLTVMPLNQSLMDARLREGAAQDGGDKAKDDNPRVLEAAKAVMEGIKMEITEEKLNELINQAVKSGVEQALKDMPARPSDVKVEKDEADQPFGSAGEFFLAVKNAAYYPHQADVRLRAFKATGLSEGIPSDGGYLLAPQIADGIIERMYKTGQVLSLITPDNVGPNSNSMLYNVVDERERTDGARWGGILSYWVMEGGAITASRPKFRQMELKLRKVAAMCYATDELLADAVALESWLNRTVPNELRFQVEAAIIRGNGVGKPLGILQSPCLVTPLRVDANEVDATDISILWSRRWVGVNDYVWFINPTVFPQLINLTLGNFPLLVPVNGGIQGAPAFTIYGRPVIETEYNPPLGTAGDILLASMSQYQAITKGGVQSASSIHVAFSTDETAFRFIYRIDGQPAWDAPLVSYAATTHTVSPFVALSAASA